MTGITVTGLPFLKLVVLFTPPIIFTKTTFSRQFIRTTIKPADALPLKNYSGYPIHVVGNYYSYLQGIVKIEVAYYGNCNFVVIVDTPYLVGMLMAILSAALFSSSASLPLASGNKMTASASLSVSLGTSYTS